jgi:hypothetical protein
MRTTLTLDRDVAARLAHIAKKRRVPFKTIVNDALRAGLPAIDKPATTIPFRTSGFDLGPSLVGSLDDVHGVLARIEREPRR